MNLDKTQQKADSVTQVVASSGSFQIELVDYAGSIDNEKLIEVSKSLEKEYGPAALLTNKTIQIYFNRKGTLPFIARDQGEIVGYMIGVPLEMLSREPWARLDANFNKSNTIYTYAFVVERDSKGTGCAKILKRVFLNQTKKQENILYVTGHVRRGIAARFKGDIDIVDKIDNWQGTGKVFEYYRRRLHSD
ncbi:MAG: hypothetical protein ACJZ2B_00820 [Candidatus Neomarinimicrobiota bacterium]|nr:hypothetical protein [Candidatus Neomarinimicrobiota bacterium]|tara:strand:+ start:1431 stop:2003 length:573 start_codon:yes stop_codon:yes gene_type:complete